MKLKPSCPFSRHHCRPPNRKKHLRPVAAIAIGLLRLQVIRLQARVTQMKQPDESDQIAAMKKRIAHLKEALRNAQAENMLNAIFLDIACREMGQDVSDFKKQSQAIHLPVNLSSTPPARQEPVRVIAIPAIPRTG